MIITKRRVTAAAQLLYDSMRRRNLGVNRYRIPFRVGYRKALDDMCRMLGAELYDITVEMEEGEDEH